MQVPGSWEKVLGADFIGTARYTRHFNRPTGLDPHERVWLCCAGARQRASIQLNGQPIGECAHEQGAQIDVTELLVPRNTLVIDVTTDVVDPPGGLTGEVRLEIRG